MSDFDHFVEVWTTHKDGVVTLFREKTESRSQAQLRLVYWLRELGCPCCSPDCMELENDFGEDVKVECTCFPKGVVKQGVFQFAAGE